MKVRNWMKADPHVIKGDMLLSEAKRILSENNLHGLPVVDDEGRLRGLLTRAHCLRAAHFVARTQSPDEFAFFSNRLQVKDMMVRNPAWLDADDTMEHTLHKGQELGVGQFPVLDHGKVVGMISAVEIFSLAAHFLSAWEKRSGITLAPVDMKPGVIGQIVDLAEAAGAEVQAIYPMGKPEDVNPTERHRKKIVIRFHAHDVSVVVKALEQQGYQVLESVEAPHGGTHNGHH